MRWSRFTQVFAVPMVVASCATTGSSPSRIPTVTLDQYALAEDQSFQSNEGVDIAIDLINPASVYDHPELFSFYSTDFGESARALELYFPPGPMNRSWVYPFASENGQFQIVTAAVQVKNNTEHTLRLQDAQIVLALEDGRDLDAVDSWGQLLNDASHFEEQDRAQFNEELGFKKALVPELPQGFYPQLLERNAAGWRLLNLDKGILPGRTVNGVLAFKVPSSLPGDATISFFDVIVQTDAAGNPSRRTQFHFPVSVEHTTFWFDSSSRRWKAGQVPTPGL